MLHLAHVTTDLHVRGEHMLGGASDEFCDGYVEQVLELLHLGQHVGYLAQVADVDASCVHAFRQCHSVHRRPRVIQAVSDLCKFSDVNNKLKSD